MENNHIILNWSEYNKHVPNTFKQLLHDEHFTDVTLVSKGGHYIKAHKVVLSFASKLFQTILVKNMHPSPLIYLKDLDPCFWPSLSNLYI